jgi:hypothetical protein
MTLLQLSTGPYEEGAAAEGAAAAAAADAMPSFVPIGGDKSVSGRQKFPTAVVVPLVFAVGPRRYCASRHRHACCTLVS